MRVSKATLTGSRVRERRLTLGMRQAAVAKSAGISASYLNLIEHNRRRIGPDVLARLAQALAVDLAILSEVAEAGVVQDLRAVAALNTSLKAELDRLEEFLGRFPGWAAVLVDVFRKATVAQNMVVALSDRMSHDPQLSAALHEVLSAISAVRASSDILTDVQDIDPEWRAKFLKNLNGDSRRLSRGAEVLVTYLDAPDKTSEAPLASATEQFDAWLTERDWRLCADFLAKPLAVQNDLQLLPTKSARFLAQKWIMQIEKDQKTLPDVEFGAALEQMGPDPRILAQQFGADIATVLRRLGSWAGLRAGLVICDASGALVFRKPIDGFVPPRFGPACALWPLYAALARPMIPLQQDITLTGQDGRVFRSFSICEASFPTGFDGPELREAVMLVLPQETAAKSDAQDVGATCRICPKNACAGRREMSIMAEFV